MDFWHVILLLTTILGVVSTLTCLYLLRKMDTERARMENYLITIGGVMADFWMKIDAMFAQSIHYYDETIYQFIQDTKDVKVEIDKVLDEYEELREFIIPIQTPEEKQKDQEKDLIGIVKNYPITRSLEVPTK